MKKGENQTTGHGQPKLGYGGSNQFSDLKFVVETEMPCTECLFFT